LGGARGGLPGNANLGTAGAGGRSGEGIGGGLAFSPGGKVTTTNTKITGNNASTTGNEVSATS
jgi:hypothetical protein